MPPKAQGAKPPRHFTEGELDLLLEYVTFNHELKIVEPADLLEKIHEGLPVVYVCPYCGAEAHIHSATKVYGSKGKTYGKMLICDNHPDCNTYVGVHDKGPREGKPLGTLADNDLRIARKDCHENYFDPLWKKEGMDRQEAYKFLSQIMGKPSFLAHIAMFNIQDCNLFRHLMKTRADWDLDYEKKRHKKKSGWDKVPEKRFR